MITKVYSVIITIIIIIIMLIIIMLDVYYAHSTFNTFVLRNIFDVAFVEVVRNP